MAPFNRQCACGKHTERGGTCASCAHDAIRQQASLARALRPLPARAISRPDDAAEIETDRLATAVLSGPAPASDGPIAGAPVQRSASTPAAIPGVPASVNGVLSEAGRPLDDATRAHFEPRFGADLGHVRIHEGARAAESAAAVHATAYTVGNHVVLGNGADSKWTMAHELAHVISPSHFLSGVRRQPKTTPLGRRANEIITELATAPHRGDGSAIKLVYDILNEYYPGYASKIAGVSFDDKEAGRGLKVKRLQSRDKMPYGMIFVGDEFVRSLLSDEFTFAHHVAQVGHELEHVDQWRAGLVGDSSKNEREFLAHYHEALFIEPAGTGAMYHSTRARYIDAALGLYNCLTQDLQVRYQDKQRDLLRRRPAEVRYGHSKRYPNPPDTCLQPDDFAP